MRRIVIVFMGGRFVPSDESWTLFRRMRVLFIMYFSPHPFFWSCGREREKEREGVLMLMAGPRPIQTIQRHCPRRRRRPQHRLRARPQKSRPPAKPRPAHRRPHSRRNRFLVRQSGKVLPCAVDGGCGGRGPGQRDGQG